jgi:alpha-galactosidase
MMKVSPAGPLSLRHFLWIGLAIAVQAHAVTPGPDDFELRDRQFSPLWGEPPPPLPPRLELLAEDASDGISRGQSWRGTPFQIGDQTYGHGLAFNANKRFRVHLEAPGEWLAAKVGLENNDDTRRGAALGNGSVTFHVSVSGRERFASGIRRLGDPPLALEVPLDGASEFEIAVNDGGDGRGWDQALWAEAIVQLRNGSQIRLQDLPRAEMPAPALSPAAPPFSFHYGGRPSTELLPQWSTTTETRPLDALRTEQVLTYRDPASGLQVRCAGITYRDFAVTEWTLYFRNTGTANTPILEKIQALDLVLSGSTTAEFHLHHHFGSPADGNDYGPRETLLGPGATHRLGGAGGRPTNADWSYFNLEWGGRGLITAVGWPGQWTATFTRDSGRNLQLVAGQELTHFTLWPGEEVRSPLIVLLFYRGDWIRSQNLWRRWMMTHSMPRAGGRLPQPQLMASSSRQYDEMINANETNQTWFIDRYLAEGIRLDYWWMDAGWYVHHGGGWPRVGTWEVDTNRFPHGLRAVSDHAHKLGLKTLLWFEPERVTAGTWLAENRPDWVLGGRLGGLLNLGNDDARTWLTERVDALLTSQGIDLYRQDFNMDPLKHWRGADAEDRQGITEIRHVTGYLAYWDELRRRHPRLLIDSCASGGRRNDLESMRRAVPLWRSDYAYEAVGHQCMTYGISLWLPFHGTGTVATRNAPYYGSGPTPVEPYAFWSNVAPSLALGVDVRIHELDYPALRRLIEQWRLIAPSFYGDFYPLTPWTRDDTAWMAWQFDRPEAAQGAVKVFRRHRSFYEAARFKLRALEPGADYTLTELGSGITRKLSGKELMNDGLLVDISDQPGVAVWRYTASSPTRTPP